MNAPIRLSKAQLGVVEFDNGPLLVVAGPGSGKTRVLTERVRRLLSAAPGHFRVLALTFTNKAANELSERLKDLGDLRQRAFIGTMHSFCLEILSDRGKPVGVTGTPQIFEQAQDRKQVLLDAVMADPLLRSNLASAGDAKAKSQRLDLWLRAISHAKTHPISHQNFDDGTERQIFDAYNAGLRASGAFDFDDLLLLTYQLFTENPKLADFYRRLYKYVCLDEAQDLNEAQYAVLQALCGADFDNVMMVGDPKQSIYGFNASGPEYMDQFRTEYGATYVELTENFRSSKAVVDVACALEPSYRVDGQLPIAGAARLLVGQDEKGEARLVVDEIQELASHGHPDIEGGFQFGRCAILGRTRFSLLAVENELKERAVPHYKRLSSAYENESDVVEEFHLALRLLVNPRDILHLSALAKKWKINASDLSGASSNALMALEAMAANGSDQCKAVIQALKLVDASAARADLMSAIQSLRNYADSLADEEKRAVYNDTQVMIGEWDQYLRTGTTSRTIAGFLSSVALGTTQQINADGVALLTVHSSKGLEFDVVFIVGMGEGVFPDYRSIGKKRPSEEELRNIFVAATRSRRLLYFSYPSTRIMPWGDVRVTSPSSYLKTIAGLYQVRNG